MGGFSGFFLGGATKGFMDTQKELDAKKRDDARFDREQKDWRDQDALDKAVNDTTSAGASKFDPNQVYQGDQGAVLKAQDADFGDAGTKATAAALNTAQGATPLTASLKQTPGGYLTDLQNNMQANGVSAARRFQTIGAAAQAAKAPGEMKAMERTETQTDAIDRALKEARDNLAGLNNKDPKVQLKTLQGLADTHSNDPQWGGSSTSKVLIDPATGKPSVAVTGADGSVGLHELTPENAAKVVQARLSQQLSLISPEQFAAAHTRDKEDQVTAATVSNAATMKEHYGKGGTAERIATAHDATEIKKAQITASAAAGRKPDSMLDKVVQLGQVYMRADSSLTKEAAEKRAAEVITKDPAYSAQAKADIKGDSLKQDMDAARHAFSTGQTDLPTYQKTVKDLNTQYQADKLKDDVGSMPKEARPGAVAELAKKGYSPQALQMLGFTPDEVRAANPNKSASPGFTQGASNAAPFTPVAGSPAAQAVAQRQAVLQQSAQVEQQQAVQQQQQADATAVQAAQALRSGNVAVLRQVQQSPAFGLLPDALKSQVFRAVQGK